MVTRSSASTQAIRKPWGGLLDATMQVRDDQVAPDFLDRLGPWVRKFCELLILTTVLVVPLAYHYSLGERTFIPVRDALLWGLENVVGLPTENARLFFDDEIHPVLTGQLPILATKFTSWMVPGLMLIGLYIGARIAEVITRRRLLPAQDVAPRFDKRNLHRWVPLLGGASFLVLAMVSILFWSPAIPPEATMSLRTGSVDPGLLGRLGGGGFLFSIIAWFQILFALLFFLVVEDLIRERTFVMKILAVLVFAGFLNALVVVLLKIGFDPLLAIWLRFEEGHYRNSLGAFIGHNTGVSSYLMAPLLICLCWLIGVQPKRRPLFQVLLGVLISLFTLAMLLAQSRAVIPIVSAAALAMFILFYRRSCLANVGRGMIWMGVALALIVASQMISTPANPFYRQDMSLTERVSQFRYSHLRTETRLRILWISMTQLVPERPLIGHGWASFQYVYPRAAGRFFEQYPETELAPTPLRTPQAHNEYLQLQVENGLLGVVIVLGSLFFLLRGGYLVMQRTIMPYHITIQIAILLAILALLLHCLFDFPLRVPPLAVTLVVLLAIWSAGDRLWLFPLRAPAEADDAPSDRVVPEEATGDAKDGSPTPKAPAAARLAPWKLVGGIAVLVAMALGQATITGVAAAPFQTAATSVTRGDMMSSEYVRWGHRVLLEQAFELASNARRVFWISGEANLLMAQVQYMRGLLRIQEARHEGMNGNTEIANQLVALADAYLMAGLSDVALSLTEQRSHHQYVLRSRIHGQLSRLHTGAMGAEFRRKAADDLQEAVAINPGDPDALFDLIRLMEGNAELNRDEITRHMRTLNYFHPVFFRQTVYQRMLDAAAVNETAEARRVLEIIRRCIDPGFRAIDRTGSTTSDNDPFAPNAFSARRLRALAANDDLRLAEGQINFLEGDSDTAWEVAGQFLTWYDRVLFPRRSVFPAEQWEYLESLQFAARILQLQDTIVKERTPTTMRLLDTVERDGYAEHITVRALRFLVGKFRQPPLSGPSIEVREAALLDESRDNPALARIIADQAEKVFRKHEEALRWMEHRRSIKEVPLDALEVSALARLYYRLGRWDDLEAFLPEMEGARGTPDVRLYVRRQMDLYREEITRLRGAGGGGQP